MANGNVELRSASTLKAYISGVIQESLKSTLSRKALQEKEKQQATSGTQAPPEDSNSGGGGNTDLFGTGDTGDDAGPKVSSKTGEDEQEKLEKGDIEPADIVDKLNSIRSGKSFKDENIKAAMEQYIGSLSKAEKVALLAFTKGIAQIVTGEVSGQDASEPQRHPADVRMTKQHGEEKHIKPNVIKAQAPVKKKQGSEDTSSPVPITPKKK